MAEADELGKVPQGSDIPGLRETLRTIQETQAPIRNKPILNGHEIMQFLDIKPTDRTRLPEVGRAGQYLLEREDDYASEGRVFTKDDAYGELSTWNS